MAPDLPPAPADGASGVPWWRAGVLYQIYVRSFADANGDGLGDLPGIIERLDHLERLGVSGVWLTPVYPSPMVDFGYDVADYTAVHPAFGTLDDMDRLIAEAHRRGIRVVLDMVPNHTSDRHPWFVESRSSRHSATRDWYLWRDPAPDGGPPNGWLSRFTGGSAWQWDETTGQYYYFTFLPEQPDLNWRSPEVREAMQAVLRFWLDRGVDGFRMDVIYRLLKDEQLRDNPPNPSWTPADHPSNQQLQIHTRNQPDVHELIRGLRRVVDEYDDRVMFGEVNLPFDEVRAYWGDGDELHFPLNHPAVVAEWTAPRFGELVRRYVHELPDGAWASWYLANHDEPRVATRVGGEQARVAMLFLLTVRGTPVIYYGDELGLENVVIPPDQVQDPWERNAPGLGLGRDPMRTPMPWTAGPNAGFCPPQVQPWLPVGAANARRAVEIQDADPTSMLALTRGVLALRRSHPALQTGPLELLDAPDGVLAYRRTGHVAGAQNFLVLLNFTGNPREVQLPEPARVVLTTSAGTGPTGDGSTRESISADAAGRTIHRLAPNDGVLLTPSSR